jgi:hypothetical protein
MCLLIGPEAVRNFLALLTFGFDLLQHSSAMNCVGPPNWSPASLHLREAEECITHQQKLQKGLRLLVIDERLVKPENGLKRTSNRHCRFRCARPGGSPPDLFLWRRAGAPLAALARNRFLGAVPGGRTEDTAKRRRQNSETTIGWLRI